MSYVYLQGAKFKWTFACLFKKPWCKKVVSDDDLVRERNGLTEGEETVVGVIALDPAMIPPLPKLTDLKLMWLLLDTPLYIDIRGIMNLIAKNDRLWCATTHTIDEVFELIFEMNEEYGQYSELIRDLTFTNPGNMNDELNDFLVRYVADSLYTPTLAHYNDFGTHRTAREYFENGGRSYLIVPPEPNPGKDGYYYYILNMQKVRVPFITLLSEYDALVEAEQIIRDLMEAKTPHQFDEYYIIEGTAHLDLPFGLKAPSEVFPKVGAWLEKVRVYPVTPHWLFNLPYAKWVVFPLGKDDNTEQFYKQKSFANNKVYNMGDKGGIFKLSAAMLAVIVLSACAGVFTTEKEKTVLEPTASGKVLKDLEDLNSGEKMYLAEEDFLKKVTPLELYESLAEKIENSSFTIVLHKVSKEEKEKFIQAWLKALSKSGHKVTVLPVSEVTEDKKSLKLDERIFKADLVAFSARPFGIFVVEDIGLLDPTKPGGNLPMIAHHEFKADFNKWFWSESVNIDFTAALYDTGAFQIG